MLGIALLSNAHTILTVFIGAKFAWHWLACGYVWLHKKKKALYVKRKKVTIEAIGLFLVLFPQYTDRMMINYVAYTKWHVWRLFLIFRRNA